MEKILFSSELNSGQIDKLNSLLFFNPGQQKVVSGIEAAIAKYGLPKIENINGILKIKVGNLPEVQTIFAFDNTEEDKPLIGIVVYFRENPEEVVILHIAVDDEYTLSSSMGNSLATLMLIDKLRNNMSKIKGINYLTIYYSKDKIGKIKVK